MGLVPKWNMGTHVLGMKWQIISKKEEFEHFCKDIHNFLCQEWNYRRINSEKNFLEKNFFNKFRKELLFDEPLPTQ